MILTPAFRLGPYEIVELLSVGGMGEIYRARDVRLGREIAVKVLPPGVADDTTRLVRFENEARAAGLLNHPNIVAVHDVGVHDGISFVVSELIEGRTLRAAIDAGGVERAQALDWAAQIARGLGAAHEGGVVHRDLKPENVMLTRDGRVKIVDFGIAKLRNAAAFEPPEAHQTRSGTEPGTLLGTVAYMSPEQVRGEAVDARTDLFSLAVILYELVCGNHPFSRSTVADTMTAVLRDAPPPMIPPDAALEAVVMRGLEKAREKRFQTAAEFCEAVDALRQLPAGQSQPRPVTVAAPQPDPGSIAVLPFANMSPDPGSEYFSDGLTEELIHALMRVRGVHVVAWHSASQMKGRDTDARTIGRELHVRTILAGSVRKAGDRVRVAARLVDAGTGFYLWSETYDRRLEDVFAIQEEIAAAIAGRLTDTLRPERAVSRRPRDVEAYNLYLRGRFFWNKRTSEGLRRSIECFERALAVDDHFALAHAGLADAHCLLADYGFVHPAEAMPRARAAAVRALELDPRSAEAHTSFAYIRSLHDWEWLEAEALYRRAIELSPGYATAHHWLAIDLLSMLGRFEEAEEEVSLAQQLDPLSLIIHEGRGYLLSMWRRFDDAIEVYRSLAELDPTFYKAYTSMGRALGFKGDYPAAIEMLEKGRSLAGDVPSILGALGQTYALAGNQQAARRSLSDLQALSSTRHVPSTTFALVHAGLGENDRALDWLERACDQHEFPVIGLKVHPAYDALRSEPRFAALLGRMRFSG